MLYRDGTDVRQDYRQAAKWLKRAAEQGYAPAQSGLAWLYERGHGVICAPGKAVQLYQQAAEKGDVQARNNL
jgi:TPR repeat protein